MQYRLSILYITEAEERGGERMREFRVFFDGYMCTCTCSVAALYVCVCVCVETDFSIECYISKERESERERERAVCCEGPRCKYSNTGLGEG